MGCDIGGTFTDFVLYNPETGAFFIDKRLTTPRDPGTAVLAGADHLTAGARTTLAAFDRLVHGTTLGINALLERKGAPTAMIVTRGFRDIIELRRGSRGELWDLSGELPPPLVPRSLRLEVDERLHSTGAVLVPLDVAQVEAALHACVVAGVTSVAVCLFHAYQNPAHEHTVRAIAQTRFPQISISLSSDVLPQMGEFERFSATAANAYLRPVMQRYLPQLEASLAQRELHPGGLRLLSSEGSQCSTRVALEYPIRVVESGPVGGVLAARHFAGLASAGEILTLDIGGTTAKTCLLANGELPIAEEYEVARVYRFQPGSGLPLNVPSVDLLEIGAGGGSLAWIGPLGMVEVGPESAGADPGPACYGNGGQRPTLTDADLVLQLLDPESFRTTARPVLPALAAKAIQSGIADRLGRSVQESALLIRQVALEKMGGAIALQLAHVGADPRLLTLVAFGGAGPLYAVDLARSIGLRKVIIPPMAAVFSALGMVMAQTAYTATRSLVGTLSNLLPSDLEAAFNELGEVATRAVRSSTRNVPPPAILIRQVELRYLGQGRSLRLGAPDLCDANAIHALASRFHQAYAQRFGSANPDSPVQMTGIRVTSQVPGSGASTPRGSAVSAEPGSQTGGSSALPETRFKQIFSGTPAETGCAVVRRAALRVGQSARGPALIEELGSTTFVSGDARFEVDAVGNLTIQL